MKRELHATKSGTESMATTIEGLGSPEHSRVRAELRISEYTFLGFLAYAEFVSLIFPLANTQRLEWFAANTLAATLIILVARRDAGRARAQERGPLSKLETTVAFIRDWLPCLLIILAYRELASFLGPQPHHPLNAIFERWDMSLLGSAWVQAARQAMSPWLDPYLELSYLLCYPVVPLGCAVVYSLSRPFEPHAAERALDRFWTGVILALTLCYAFFPVFPLVTPRLLFHGLPDSAAPAHAGFALRRFNLWLLGQFAGAGGVFPSGHVAGAAAVALSVWNQSRRWGIVFGIIAASIAMATVLERYHYTADAISGIFIAAAAVPLSRFLLKLRPHNP